MYLSSLLNGSYLLVSLEDHFYQRLLRYAKQKIFCFIVSYVSYRTYDIKTSFLKYKIVVTFFCGNPVNSKETEALHYSGTTFWVRTPPMFG